MQEGKALILSCRFLSTAHEALLSKNTVIKKSVRTEQAIIDEILSRKGAQKPPPFSVLVREISFGIVTNHPLKRNSDYMDIQPILANAARAENWEDQEKPTNAVDVLTEEFDTRLPPAKPDEAGSQKKGHESPPK